MIDYQILSPIQFETKEFGMSDKCLVLNNFLLVLWANSTFLKWLFGKAQPSQPPESTPSKETL